ncbi:MAG: twin-arginine translocase TatA/TatE family subunit [Armatimonadota bacterium]
MLTNLTTLAYFGGTQEWLIIGVVVLVLFGGTKIPQLARGFGEGIREFKKSINGDDSETTTTPKSEADAAAK